MLIQELKNLNDGLYDAIILSYAGIKSLNKIIKFQKYFQ